MSKLGLKFFIIILIISMGGLIFTSFYINYSIDKRFFDYLYIERKEEIESLVGVVEDTLYENNNWETIAIIINDFVKVNRYSLLLIDIEGNIIYNSPNSMMDGMMNGMMDGMMGRRHNNLTNRNQNNFNRDRNTIAKNSERFTIEYQGETIAYLYWHTGRETNTSDKAAAFTKRINRIIILAGVLVALVTILISLYISRRLTLPLIEMNKIAGKVSRGEFNHSVKIKGSDELAELGQSFNEMVAKLNYLERIRKESTSDLAHELRTPLTTINSYLEGIKEGIIKTDNKTINEIEEELQRLISLVNRLGELANAEKRIINRKKELISFSEILRHIIKRQEPLAKKNGISLMHKIQSGITVIADPKNLETIVINLISNSLKYTPANGDINISLSKEGEEVILTVSDTGIGISNEDKAYIFERFYRVDKSRSIKTGGTGIGLTITRELVNSMNGSIEVFSPGENQGTTFIVKLPIVRGN